MLYSWQQSQWEQLLSAPENFHHGLLFHGEKGIGKREFCIELSRSLLCESPDGNPASSCGKCQNCKLFDAGSHPDFHLLSTEYEAMEGRLGLFGAYCDRYQDVKERDRKTRYSRVISVDQIRSLIERFSTHPHISKSKVALIAPAESLNSNAANALLKLLEEPPAESFLILSTSEPNRLPATIRSRCMSQAMALPDWQNALNWLEQYIPQDQSELALSLANGGPVEARRLFEAGLLEQQQNCITGIAGVIANRVNPIDLAGKLNKIEFEEVLIWLQKFAFELIKWSKTGGKPVWPEVAKIEPHSVSYQRLCVLYDRISSYRRIANDSVNSQLAIEDLTLAFQRITISS